MIGFSLSMLVTACSQSKQEEVAESKSTDKGTPTINKKNYPDKSELAKKDELVQGIEESRLITKSTISLNGEKYIIEGGILRQGAVVQNINMSEKGRVKGTFVIVTKSNLVLEPTFKSKMKIAKDTFRLTPMNTDDLKVAYKQLLRNKSIDLVELEIEYSGAKGNRATR